MTASIVLESIGKRYYRYDLYRPWTIQEAILGGFSKLRPRSFWALRNISFTLQKGHTLGIIGRNGAGKSALLRVLAAVSRPDEGRIAVNGRVSGLLDLGTGFHGDLTGRENVFIYGVIGGLLRREIARDFDSIVDFAELRDVIDSPLRTYSSGMQLRLAFAIATHVRPDILLVDEILAVGDAAFQRKCLERIADFKASGSTIVVVSHDMGMVRDICDEALLLRGGSIAACGDPSAVTEEYLAEEVEGYRVVSSQ